MLLFTDGSTSLGHFQSDVEGVAGNLTDRSLLTFCAFGSDAQLSVSDKSVQNF